MKEYFNKFGSEGEIQDAQTTSFTMDFIQKEGVNVDYFGQCIDYKSSTATIQMAARIVYNCFPILQDYHAFQNKSLKSPNLEEDFYNSTSYKYKFWWMNKNLIDACKDYEQCPWDELERLPSQDFFDPKASQSVVTRAKETYFALHGEGSQTIDACFTSLVLSMRKNMQNCKTFVSKYKKALQEHAEKSSLKELSKTVETSTIISKRILTFDKYDP